MLEKVRYLFLSDLYFNEFYALFNNFYCTLVVFMICINKARNMKSFRWYNRGNDVNVNLVIADNYISFIFIETTSKIVHKVIKLEDNSN